MAIFYLILLLVLAFDLVWWALAHRGLRSLKRRRLWRGLLALFMALQFGYLLMVLILPRGTLGGTRWLPIPLLSAIYLWHLLILPITLVVMLAGGVLAGIVAAIRALSRPAAAPAPLNDEPALSRRDVLGLAVAAVPPLVTGGLTVFAGAQLREFRVRPLEIGVPGLPPPLDGMTIAHISDVHVGRYTRGRILRQIADATNALRADLVVMTGDLIDVSLSDLPEAMDWVRQLDPRHGLALCEGNHDLIENPLAFESGVRTGGLPLLIGESKMVSVRGQPVQFMGLPWSRGDEVHAHFVRQMQAQRLPWAFPILLAHHPHAFDAAAQAGFPLTLSGHTHGGQLMLNERLGAGPILFRYISGEYRKGTSHLVVSNGVGNWFPLRTRAPAEIIHLTLRCT